MENVQIANPLQRARQHGETEEELDQKEHHSVQSLQASHEGEEHIDRTEKERGEIPVEQRGGKRE